MSREECPCCGRAVFPPRVSVRTASWSDECCCDDTNTCAYHNVSDDPRPDRPSEEVLLQRAEDNYRQAREKYERQLERFVIVRKLLQEI